jgi:hypothetical protein
MSDDLNPGFSDRELQTIIDQAMIYMCACPAQVAEQLQRLRGLHAYQRSCIAHGPLAMEVHQTIAAATTRAHDELESCLERVLKLEGWDRATLAMPEGLRQARDEQISRS